MEKLYPTTGSIYATLVVTDNKWKRFLSRDDVPDAVMRKAFDWLGEEAYEGFIKYGRDYLHTSQFERLPDVSVGKDWDGVHNTSGTTGELIKISKDGEEYKIGSHRTVTTDAYQEQKQQRAGLRKNPDDGPLTEAEKSGLRRQYAKKFGLSAAEAAALVDSGHCEEINNAVYDWAAQHGVEQSSPSARGYLLELLHGRGGMRRNSGSSPRDLRRLTPAQTKSAISRLSKLSLSELRRRQALIEKQRQVAYGRGQEDSLVNLDIMGRHLIAAIDQKEFHRNGRLGLERVKVLFRLPDTLALYGIPYELRPGQSPKDLHGKFRTDWIFLGYPGWFGPIPDADTQEIKEFLAQHAGNIPENPYEWTRIDTSAQLPDVDVGDGKRVRIANPLEFDAGSLFYFSFGAYGDTHVLVWGRGVEDALEEATGYLRDTGLDGIFVDDENLQSLLREVQEEFPDIDEDEAQEKATADLTYTEAGYIPSFEWWVDDVTDPQLLAVATNVSKRYTEAF